MERQTVCLRVEEVAQNLELEILEPGNGSVVFSTGEIGRPGLQFTGFYEHFMPQRVQLIGNAEMILSLYEFSMSYPWPMEWLTSGIYKFTISKY